MNNPGIVDDIVQDVFLKVHLHLNKVRSADRIQHWMYRIAQNAITDHFRKQKPVDPLETLHVLPDVEPEREVEQEIAPCLIPMIQALPKPYREAVHLAELEGLKQAEVAERLGLSLSGAKSRIQRGRRMLKSILLDCCRFEFDQRGRVMDYTPRATSTR